MSRAINIASPRNHSITHWTTSDISAWGLGRCHVRYAVILVLRDYARVLQVFGFGAFRSFAGALPPCASRWRDWLGRGGCTPGCNPFSGRLQLLTLALTLKAQSCIQPPQRRRYTTRPLFVSRGPAYSEHGSLAKTLKEKNSHPKGLYPRSTGLYPECALGLCPSQRPFRR